MKTAVTATDQRSVGNFFKENCQNDLFSAPKTFLYNGKILLIKSKPTKIFTNGKRLEDTFQFVHYLNCISNVKND